MKLVLIMLLSLPLLAKTPLHIARDIEKELINDSSEMPYTKKLINQGMNRAIELAVFHLNEKGEFQLAEELRVNWESVYRRDMFISQRDIGDHKPIFQFINDMYRKIEMVLGRDFCVSTHIAAMLTFNSANVAVKPCSFPMDNVPGDRIDEYRRHMAGKSPVSDSNYYGIIPEAVYFSIQIGCLVGTSGIGSFLCSLAASAGSRAIAMFVAPRLSDRIYTKRCEGRDIGDF